MSDIGETGIKVSVIIPVYNMENYITDCLGGVLQQSLREIEVICVDDGSTDCSLRKLREYARKDARIKVIATPNRGSGPARNVGMAKARGEYIAFMDADDSYPADDVLEILYRKAVETCSDICGGSVKYTNVQGKPIACKVKQHVFKEDGYILAKDYQWCFGYWRFLYRRQFLKENKITFQNYLRFQDPPFMLNAIVHAQTIYAMKKETYSYRVDYKRVSYDEKRLVDYIHGITDVLRMTNEYQLKLLHNYIINVKLREGVINNNLQWNDRNAYRALEKMEEQINYNWIEQDKPVTKQLIRKARWNWLKNHSMKQRG